jgi:hypothetical protein
MSESFDAISTLSARFSPTGDLHVAAAGHLTRWQGQPLDAARHENNVWCRRASTGPWVLDVIIGEGTDRAWIYRRDPSVRVPWDLAVLQTAHGIPYLAPDLQLRFKSKGLRPKDDVDAAAVIPALDGHHRARLARLLEPGPWQHLLD